MKNTNIDVNVTISFRMNNLIDEDALREVYLGNLRRCVECTIQDEGLWGVLELETVEILDVQEA